jgi:S-sulfosulfanyl-L-cysteine sulfohydrolase
MSHNRRNFLKTLSLSAGAGLISASSFDALTPVLDKEEEFDHMESKEDLNKGIITVSILQTTDIHCQIHPHDELFWENDNMVFRKTGGYAHLYTYLNQYKKKNPETFLVDTGDMFQGSELSVKTEGKAMVPILNAMGYEAYIPGNWEVIYYKKNMQQLLGTLQAPKVCTNMYHDLGNGVKGELIFPAYHIWHTQGIKIGFLSYTDHLVPIRQSPNYSSGIIYTKPEDNIAYYIDVLKSQEHCNFIIVLAHMGLSQQIHLANLEVSKGVDYILGGDTHERVRVPIQCKYAKVVEPGAFGSFVGKLKLTFEHGKLIKDNYELVEISTKKYKADKKISQLISEIEKPYVEDINKVIGHSTIPLYRYFVIENTIDTLILDALRNQVSGIDIVLSNGFRFCPPRATPDKTGNIPITNGYVFDMLPVDSVVRTAKVTGKQIAEWLEKELNNVFAENASERFGGWVIKFDGMKVVFNAFGEKGKRVQTVTVGNKPLDLNKTYSLCACERDGDPVDVLCRIKGVTEMKNTQYTLHQVMKNYLQANPIVTPTPKKNAVALDAPATLLTQVTGVDYQFI